MNSDCPKRVRSDDGELVGRDCVIGDALTDDGRRGSCALNRERAGDHPNMENKARLPTVHFFHHRELLVLVTESGLLPRRMGYPFSNELLLLVT